MEPLTVVVVGMLAGAHTSTWGMYKDAVHEGFTVPKYLRSIVLSSGLALLVAALASLDVTRPGHLLVLFGVTYIVERAATEFYKTFLREEDQSKYFIPMQFAVRGRIVRSRRTRLLIGAGVVAAGLMLIAAAAALQPVAGTLPLPVVILLGSAGGWVSAFGGAWKDAPIEGFEVPKFFRSPVCAGLYAFLLWPFTGNLVLTGLAALGFTIATLETYKTFFFPSKPRGKFAGKPILYPQMVQRRNWFVPLYVGIWLALFVAFIRAH